MVGVPACKQEECWSSQKCRACPESRGNCWSPRII